MGGKIIFWRTEIDFHSSVVVYDLAKAWEQRKLGDVVEFLDTMRKPLEGAKRISGPYPYYGASGIVDYVDGYLFDEELVLLSEDGANITDRNYPVCFLASGKYWVNNHAHVLKTKDGNENNFICNSLERKDYKQYNSGMAMPKLNQEVCRGIPISCPSFDEQKKIGDYFRNLDHLITLHQRKCDEMKKLKKYMLQKMFPRKGMNVPEIRFNGFTDAWEQRKFSELYEKNVEKNTELIGYDKTVSIATMTYKDEGNGASDESLKTYKVLRTGDLAFEGHTNKDFRYGRFVANDIGTGIMSPRFSTLRPVKDMPVSFWKYYIHYEPIMRSVLVNSTKAGTMMNELVVADFMKQSIRVPSISEQEKIGDYFSNLDHLITLHQRKCEELQLLKKFMLQNMFI